MAYAYGVEDDRFRAIIDGHESLGTYTVAVINRETGRTVYAEQLSGDLKEAQGRLLMIVDSLADSLIGIGEAIETDMEDENG